MINGFCQAVFIRGISTLLKKLSDMMVSCICGTRILSSLNLTVHFNERNREEFPDGILGIKNGTDKSSRISQIFDGIDWESGFRKFQRRCNVIQNLILNTTRIQIIN